MAEPALYARLELRIREFEKQMQRAQRSTEGGMRGIENRTRRAARVMETSITKSASRMARSLGGALAVAGGLRGFQSLIDGATRVDNALKVAGLAGEELERVYARLRDSAIKNAAPLESLVTLFGRASQVQKELGVTTEELLGFTDKVALALRVAGTDAGAASGALLQLSQALGGSVVRSEEFNSVLEGALPIAQAAAAGLTEAGGSVAKLRELVVDGKVSSEAFFRAFEAGAVILEQKVAGATLTTAQGLNNVQTAMVDAAREFAKGSLAADTLGDAFQQMANLINGIDFEAFGQKAQKLVGVIGQIRDAMNWVQNAGANFGAATGLDQIGEAITGGAVTREIGPITLTSQRALQRRIDEAFGAAVESAGNLTEEAIRRSAGQIVNETDKQGRIPASTVKPVSLADFATPTADESGSGGSGKGRKRKSAKERENDYERLTQQIKESTTAVEAETAALAGVNPLVDDYGYSVEYARTRAELLTAAQKAGLVITPSLTAEIDKLASGYASATAEAERLDEAQRDVQQRAEEMQAFGKDVFGGFIRDIIQGKKASDALADSLDKVADKLLDIALNSVFDSKGGGFLSGLFGGGGGSDPWAGMRNVGKPSGGLLGGWLIPGFLKDGGEVKDGPKGVVRGPGGPRGDKIATMLSDGEFVVNSAATRKHRAMLEAINRDGLQFRANGGGVGYSLPSMQAPTMPDLRGLYLPKVGGSGRNEVVRVELQADPSLMVKVAQQEIRTAAGPIVQIAVAQSGREAKRALPPQLHNRSWRGTS